VGLSLRSLIADDPALVGWWDMGGFPDFARDRSGNKLHLGWSTTTGGPLLLEDSNPLLCENATPFAVESGGTAVGRAASLWANKAAASADFATDASYGSQAVAAGAPPPPGLLLLEDSNSLLFEDAGPVSLEGAVTVELALTGSLTIEAIVQLDAPPAAQAGVAGKLNLGGTTRDYLLSIDTGLQPTFEKVDPGAVVASKAGGALTAGRAYHLAGRFDDAADTVEVLVNGIPTGAPASTATGIRDTATSFVIGCYNVTSLGGRVGLVAVYNGALTDPVLSAHAQAAGFA
jgi:hypothetical protein